MTPELALSLAKIAGSVALLAVVLAAVGALGRRLALQPEVARKIIHVALGLYCLTFPLVFSAAWEVAAVCALAGVVFVVARSAPALGQGLHGVKRFSYGELLFALSVALLFYLKDGHYVLALHGVQSEPRLILYVLPLLILTLCDAASALVGVNYGKNFFAVEEGVKSVEGVVAFIVTAWLASLIALLLLTDLPRGDVIVLALITALFGALFEAASWKGLDNLFIPVGLYFILSNLLPRGLDELLWVTLGFAVISLLLAGVGVKLGMTRHLVASVMSLLLCIIVFAGPLAILTPCLVFAVYYFVWREGARTEVAHDPLNMLITVLALALATFLLSALISVDTILMFNLMFGCLAAGVLIRLGRFPLPWKLAGLAVIAAVSLVRAAAEAGWEGLQVFAAVSTGIILFAAMAAWLLRRWPGRPWIKLGALSFALGLVALPLSPHGWPLPGMA